MRAGCTGTPDFGVAEPPPLPLSRNGQLHYEVEKIIDHQRIGRIGRDGSLQLQYRVLWQGYQPADNTWELDQLLREDSLDYLIWMYHKVTRRPFEAFHCAYTLSAQLACLLFSFSQTFARFRL